MSPNAPSYKVTKLEAGTVIDHIEPGCALVVLRLLQIDPAATVALGINFPSKKQGSKDIIKVENQFLGPEDISVLSLISPEATISIIRDFEVCQKLSAETPDRIEGLLSCPNAVCICNHENAVTTRFAVTSTEPVALVCHYCERSFGRDQLQLR